MNDQFNEQDRERTLAELRKERIGHQLVVAHLDWLGLGDYTAIWFAQRLGGRTRIVGYYQNEGEGLKHYVDEAARMARERGWTLGAALWPHDGRVREWGSGKGRQEQFRDYTGKFPVIVPRLAIDDGIAAVRQVLPSCEFDAAACADGLKVLKTYRKEWDDERGVWRDRPRHDSASHGADAFRTLATRLREYKAAFGPPKPKHRDKAVLVADHDGSVRYAEPFSVLEWAERRRKRAERDW